MVDHVQPDFLIIGAAKAATTWLQLCLQEQSSVFMPDPETHYFSRNYHHGADWYDGFFADAPEGVLIGEKSNSYFEQPDAMQRIKTDLPEARLILQFRNPIERAYSDYCMLYRRGEVDARIEDHFKEDSPFGDRFLEGGRYGHHIDHIDSLFPAEQVLILVYDDVKARPAAHLDRVRTFLGLAELTPIDARVKDKTEAILPLPVRRVLKGLKPAVAPFREDRWFAWLRGLAAREIRYPVLTPSLHASLRDYYAKDIEKLARRLDRDLSPWLSDPSRREITASDR